MCTAHKVIINIISKIIIFRTTFLFPLFSHKVDQWSAYLEMGAMVMLLVNLALPTRNIGQLVLWAQNLQVSVVLYVRECVWHVSRVN